MKYPRDLLFRTSKPARYFGAERFAAGARPDAEASIVLVFPDIYEIGMSHLGIRILYDIVASDPRFAVERAFSPWRDMEREMRRREIPLLSRETGRPIRDFDLVGFSLQYELSYPDILNALDLGGVRLRTSERSEDDPIVLAGGPTASHAGPLHRFIDLFMIGEAEEAIIEIMEAIGQTKGLPREERIRAAAGVGGVFAPAIGNRASRRFVPDLDASPLPASHVVPSTKIIHDRLSVEVTRGCTRGCRFCQAGYIYRPLRHRSPKTIVEYVDEVLAKTGMEEVALLALSTCDHPAIGETARHLARRLSPRKVSISLPSTRVDAFDPGIHRLLGGVRRTGITLAPEIGTERMDRIINKGANDEDFERAVLEVFKGGWKRLKLYFIFGLPYERDEDVRGIAERISRAAAIARRFGGRIHASISVFVPKPWTPFQRRGIEDPAVIEARGRIMREASRAKNVDLEISDPAVALVEAALARSGAEAGEALAQAWRSGLRLQGWSDHFRSDSWETAFGEAGLDLKESAGQSFDSDDELPWESVEMGVTREFLEREESKARRAAADDGRDYEACITDDCSRSGCSSCGLFCAGTRPHSREGRVSPPGRVPILPLLPRYYIEALFERTEECASSSHLDTALVIERAFRASGIPVAYSQGFNPRPRIILPYPLPLGVIGRNEIIFASLRDEVDPAEIPGRLNAALPMGLRILSASALGSSPSIEELAGASYRIETNLNDEEIGEILEEKVRGGPREIRTGGRTKTVDPKYIGRPVVSGGGLDLDLPTGGEGNPGIVPTAILLFGRNLVSIERKIKHRKSRNENPAMKIPQYQVKRPLGRKSD